ncbi:MAG: tail fiber protein [Stenotrophomonas sp.]|uniref:phage tail protein n=1 Tax=Stenotrophomonas sp. TaxID=69392 RepID=UPI002FC77AE6
MSDAYVGEIRMFGFSRVPTGWLACDGTLQSIAEYEVLYTLLGTTYGGDGQSTFGVPDLRGRVPLHQGTGPGLTNRPMGQMAGTESVTLTPAQMPAHTHVLSVTTAAATLDAPSTTALPGSLSGESLYLNDITGAAALPMEETAVSVSGGNQSHGNCMPTLTVQFCICCAGIYPSQG